MLDQLGDSRGLTSYVAASAVQACKQGDEIGALYKQPFQFKQAHSLAEHLKKGEQRITMTQAMFKRLVSNPELFAHFRSIVGESGSLRFILDEVHQIYKSAKVAKAVESARGTGDGITISGLTGTLGFDPSKPDSTLFENAVSVMGRTPCIIEYTPTELEALHADLNTQPKPPQRWRKVGLPNPDEAQFVHEMVDLKFLLVGAMIFSLEECSRQWLAERNLVSHILATQVHGEDGGKLFDELELGGVPMRPVLGVVEGEEPTLRMESVLVAHMSTAGTTSHLSLLEDLQGREGVRPFTIHDLRAKDMAKARQQLHQEEDEEKGNGFFPAVRAQRGATIGFVKPSQTQSTNDFAKNVSAVAAVGGWSTSQLNQFGGRLGRPCELVEGDWVPKAFKQVHFPSEWARGVTMKKGRPPPLSDKVFARLSAMEGNGKPDAEDKARILAAKDKMGLFPGTTSLVDCYMEAIGSESSAFRKEFYAVVDRWAPKKSMGNDEEDDEEGEDDEE